MKIILVKVKPNARSNTLVAQDDGSWLLREYFGAHGVVEVARLGARIALDELYSSTIDVD